MIHPVSVSGRQVSNRGVHLQPFGFHGYWCQSSESRAYWLSIMQSMHLSWCVMLTDSDSCLEVFDGKPVVTWLLEAGIIPIVRWMAPWNKVFTGADVVRKLVPLYAPFGLDPFFQIYNEPGDGREVEGTMPDPWWPHFITRWNDAARQVIQAGGLPGMPDGPGYNFTECHPFRDTERGYWLDGWAWYGVHNYGKNRPLTFPYDDVTQNGTPLTEAEYRVALGVFADDPAWYDLPLETINAQRKAWASPGLTALEDDVCWNAWQKIDHYAREAFGHSVPMAMTEGGWQPRDRAGSGNVVDVRWPYTTPEMVAEKTLAMFEADSPMFAQCPWLLACSAMGGSGWEFDSWLGWAFQEEHGWEKPVVKMLQDSLPGCGEPGDEGQVGEVRALVSEALGHVRAAQVALREGP